MTPSQQCTRCQVSSALVPGQQFTRCQVSSAMTPGQQCTNARSAVNAARSTLNRQWCLISCTTVFCGQHHSARCVARTLQLHKATLVAQNVTSPTTATAAASQPFTCPSCILVKNRSPTWWSHPRVHNARWRRPVHVAARAPRRPTTHGPTIARWAASHRPTTHGPSWAAHWVVTH
jgi:hypothetical protein